MLQQGRTNGLMPAQHQLPAPRLLLGSCRGVRPTQLQGPPPALPLRHDVSNAASQQAADRPMTSNSSAQSASTDLTELAGHILTHGNGMARRVLSDPHLEGAPLDFLKQTEAYWKALKQQQHDPHKPGPTVITTSSSTISSLLQDSSPRHSSSSSSTDAATPQPRPPSFGAAPAAAAAAAAAAGSHGLPARVAAAAPAAAQSSSSPDFDVVMCGGTLGICVALALQQKGYRVAVVERRRVEGRLQEWNSSRHEMQVLVDLGLLTAAELEAVIVSEFNPIRVGFKGGSNPITVNNVLNIGVCPKTLIKTLRSKFEVLGGVVYEHTAFKSGVVGSDGVLVSLAHAAGAPADVGDTNRPNAMQEEQQQQVSPLHSPFGRVAGSAGNAAAAAGVAQSNGSAARHSSSSSCCSGSGYERWVAAAGSNGWLDSSTHATHTQQAAPDQHSTGTNGGRMQQQTPTQQHIRGTAAAVSQGSSSSSRRRAPSKLTCRLLLDCMGHYSPIVKQLRGRAKPDGMVLVVGGCATGFAPEANTSADLLYSFTDAAADMQLFWEAFPAEGGASRTTYMFAYTDADPRRPNFEKLLDTYFTLMPAYQGLSSLESVKFKRVLFGGFPCYSSTTPLGPGFDRVLQLGDASASQSPLSFGGFGSMLRHLGRLSGAVGHALREDRLSRQDLAWVHPYQPSLSAAWLFQRSMSVQVGQTQQQQQQQQSAPAAATAADAAPAAATAASSSSSGQPSSSDWWRQLLLLPAGHINALLGANFTAMAILGQCVMKPFLQDTLQLGPLAAAMCGMMLLKPLVIARVFVQVGPKVLLGWFGHFAMLAAYTLVHHLLKPLRHISSSYTWCRLLDALKYGSSSDYRYSSSTSDDVLAGVASSGSGSKVVAPQEARVGADASRVVAPVGAVANNIVPAVPYGIWGQHEVVHSNKGSQQQQPSAA